MKGLGKMLRSFVFTLLCVMTILSPGSVQAGDITDSRLPSSGSLTLSLEVWNDDDHTLYMDSLTAGTWTFSVTGNPGLAFDCWPDSTMDPPPVYVFTYWRDSSVSGDPWHYWGGGGAICWPTSIWSTRLYSGSKYIEYKFVFENYGDTPAMVYPKFTKK